MSVTININNLSLCHKGSNGISTATIPDVCKTPSPGGPVPIPYPNIAFSKDLMKGTTTVSADGGNMCANYGSEFFKSTGDEPGVVGGVASSTFIKEATWITYSFDVKFEGKAACRLTDKMFHNHQNTVNLGGEIQKPVVLTPPECAAMWGEIDKEVKATTSSNDPFERNRKISAAYAGMYERRPDYQWIGLASVVSRQAGCAMVEAKGASSSILPMKSGPAATAFDALQKTNKSIYEDIYPGMRFAEKYGLAKLKQCNTGPDGKPKVAPKVMDALEDIEKGTPESLRGAADKIANYEQRDIVQDRIYANSAYKEAFAKNEYWADTWLGRQMGAKRPELPLSPDCGGTAVPFQGSILNAEDRVKYYGKLMDTFRGKDPAWTKGAMDAIIKQGQ